MVTSEDDNWIVIPTDVEPSDGDSSLWPTEAKWAVRSDRSWRIGLAEWWLQKTGAYEKGKCLKTYS